MRKFRHPDTVHLFRIAELGVYMTKTQEGVATVPSVGSNHIAITPKEAALEQKGVH